ncbi:hypothetical protein [Mycobacterium sp. Lab-001]|uniref:hypothetical protein n=1 Tax=Mycobacterium sp. Lab-001 TaxID=3410136 RepID=UPI003D1853C3
MTVKSRAKGIAAASAVIGAAAAAVTSVAVAPPIAPQVQLATFGAPLPLDPATDVPSAGQVVSVLNGIANPNVAAAEKSGLVEGGLSPIEQSVMDSRMRKGLENGKLPLTISTTNIQPAGPGAATADVTASSAKLQPHSVNLKFVNQDGWKLSHSSLMRLSQMSSN